MVYFEKEEFPEIEAFMRQVSETYGFEFQRYSVSYKDGMQDLVDSRGIEVCVGGGVCVLCGAGGGFGPRDGLNPTVH